MSNIIEIPILIVGTTAAGRAAASALQLVSRFIYGYLSLDFNEKQVEIDDLPVLGGMANPDLKAIFSEGKTDYVIAASESALRLSLLRELLELSKKLPLNVVHPAAWVDETADLAAGCLVGAGSLIGAGAKLEACCQLELGVLIEAEAGIGSACTLATGSIVGSGAHLGNHVFIGAGAVVGSNVRIGDRSTIAPGAVVLRDCNADSQLVGNPAKVL